MLLSLSSVVSAELLYNPVTKSMKATYEVGIGALNSEVNYDDGTGNHGFGIRRSLVHGYFAYGVNHGFDLVLAAGSVVKARPFKRDLAWHDSDDGYAVAIGGRGQLNLRLAGSLRGYGQCMYLDEAYGASDGITTAVAGTELVCNVGALLEFTTAGLNSYGGFEMVLYSDAEFEHDFSNQPGAGVQAAVENERANQIGGRFGVQHEIGTIMLRGEIAIASEDAVMVTMGKTF